jgi:hypothetical protein
MGNASDSGRLELASEVQRLDLDILRQQQIIKDLEKDGRSSLGARTMLRLLEESRRILLERLGVQPEVKL